jgi:hypothetical protein
MDPDSRLNRWALNFGRWCCLVTIGVHGSLRNEALTAPSEETESERRLRRSGTELLKCTDLPEGPELRPSHLMRVPGIVEIINHLHRNHPVRHTRLFGQLFAFPLGLAAGNVAPVRGALLSFYYCRSAPLKLRQLFGFGLSIRLQFVLNRLAAVRFLSGQAAPFSPSYGRKYSLFSVFWNYCAQTFK